MLSADARWLGNGAGEAPQARWSFATEAELAALEIAREAGETLAGDQAGGLVLLNRLGEIISINRGFQPLGGAAIADDGSAAAVIIGETRVCRLSRQLKIEWTVDLPEPVLAVALDPYGEYLAVSTAGRKNLLYAADGRAAVTFETVRPLSLLRFVAAEPAIVGAADYGLVCWYRLNGEPLWSEQLWSNVGDLAITGDARSIFLAGFNHGIQIYNAEGESTGALVVEGTASRVSCSFLPKRIAAATFERHLYWLDARGGMVWAAAMPDDAVRLHCEPLGRGLWCGFRSGQILRLEWLDGAGPA